MSNSCLFCDEGAKPWPDYVGDYIREYNFCEYHQRIVLGTDAVKPIYDAHRVQAHKAANLLTDAMSKAYDLDPEVSTNEDYCDLVLDLKHIAEQAISENIPDLSEPIGWDIDIAEADRLISVRIKSTADKVARNIPVARCPAGSAGSPDQRCINPIHKGYKFCFKHKDQPVKFSDVVDSKIPEILKQMRAGFIDQSVNK